MSAKDAFALALRVMGLWFIAAAAASAIGGYFGQLIVGIALVVLGTGLAKGVLRDN